MATKPTVKESKDLIDRVLTAMGFKTSPHLIEIIDRLDRSPRGTRFGVSGPRQIFKTEIAIAWLFLGALKGENGVFFAHDDDLRKEVFARMAEVCEPLISEGVVERVNGNVGFYEIKFPAAVVRFRVRGAKAKVGLTNLSRIVFDESQLLDAEFYNTVVPTMIHGKSDKALLIGNPPTRENLRLVPNNKFVEMRASQAGGKFWVEFTAAPKYKADLPVTPAARRKANPAHSFIPGFGKDTRQLLLDLGHEAFCQIYLGVWIEFDEVVTSPPLLSSGKVQRLLTTVGSDAARFHVSVGITLDSESAWVCMSDGKTLEIPAEGEFDLRDGDLDSLASWLRKMSPVTRTLSLPGNSRGKALEALLRELRYPANKIRLLALADTSNRFSRLLRQVEAGDVRCFSTPPVKRALQTFWSGFDPKVSAPIPRGPDGDVEAIMLALSLGAQPDAKAAGSLGGLAALYGASEGLTDDDGGDTSPGDSGGLVAALRGRRR